MQCFISDLHLCATQPRTAALFHRFIDGQARQASAVYVLGDLFDYWAGDDDLDDPFNRDIVTALRSLTRRVPVGFIAGNRDFLVGDEFSRATGVTLLDDPTLIDLDGTATVVSHGDLLCTDDVAYQRFRAQVRSTAWREAFLARPLTERRAEIAALRRASEAAKRTKADAIMDVNAAAVAELHRRNHYARLIHGHTHRPARHRMEVDGHRCERWVLADWGETGQCLVAQGGELRTEIVSGG